MREDTFKTVSNLLAVMPAQVAWDERVAVMYAYALNDWDDNIVEYAVKKALLTHNFRPTPAELRKVALSLIAPMQSAMQLHGTISTFISKVHPSQRYLFMDKQISQGLMNPIIREIVDKIGGWREVGARASEDNLRLIEKVHHECYDALNFDELLASPPDGLKSIGSGVVKAIASVT
jgi:hypothetical protein